VTVSNAGSGTCRAMLGGEFAVSASAIDLLISDAT
jgi:hypothetical protein